MMTIKELVHEVHRRSLWQVTAIFLAASWGVLQVVQGVTDSAGLPDWTPSMALVLLLLGLPVVLATAFVQEGMPGASRDGAEAGSSDVGSPELSTGGRAPAGTPLAVGEDEPLHDGSARSSGGRRLFTWKNAIFGGVGAFALLGLSLMGYFVMWSAGVGPMGSLVAQGVIEEGVRVVLADFDDESAEGMGDVVTEALRVDLTEAEVLDLADPSEFTGTLERMQIDPGTPFAAPLAMEVAERDGIGAVIDGRVAAVGEGYLITATLRDGSSGAAISTFRSPAATAGELIAAIDKLSQDIREKSGESLREIKRGEPLEQVTTSSLDALRLYSESDALFGIDEERNIEMLEQAVQIDPEFAMAWRKLAAAYNNLSSRRNDMPEAATQAFEHRDRLPPRERYLTEAFYYAQIADDPGRAADAYRAVLEIDPANGAALNNLGNVYNSVGDVERGAELHRRAAEAPGGSVTAHSNLVLSELSLGRTEAAAGALDALEAAYPNGADNAQARFHVLLMSGARGQASDFASDRLTDPLLSSAERALAAQWLAKLSYREGRFAEAREHVSRAVRVAAEINEFAGAGQLFTGAYWEGLMGGGEAAGQALRTFISNPAFERFDTDRKSITAFSAIVAGEVDVAREILSGGHGPLNADLSWPRRVEILLRAAEGSADDALAEMEALREVEGCLGPGCWLQERAMAAELAGDLESAIEVYEYMTTRSTVAWPVIGFGDRFAELRLAPLLEQTGDSARAIEVYQRLAERWANGDAEGQARVRAFQNRIAALGG